MVLEQVVAGLIGTGMFWIAAVFAFFGLVELIGKVYGTFRCLVRNDLTSEQRIIYLLLIWFIPLGWLIYFLLGTERTQQLFSEVDFL